jgi:hypothetical protein
VEERERRARLFATCIYVPIGLFAAIVGGHDAFVAAEVSSRSGGMLLLLGGLILLALVAALLMPAKRWSPRRRWAPRAAMYAAGIGALIGVSLTFAQVVSPDGGSEAFLLLIGIVALVIAFARRGWSAPRLLALVTAVLVPIYLLLDHGHSDGRVVAWIWIVAASGLAAVALRRTDPPTMGVTASKVLIGTIGFVSLSALVGLAQFWYTTQYLPSNEKVFLLVESKLRRLGSDGGADVVELTVRVKNISEIPAEILGSVYRVTGSSARPIDHSGSEPMTELVKPVFDGKTVSRYRRGSSWDLVQTGLVVPRHWWLGAEEEFSRVALVHVPHGRYDTLRAQGEVLTAKRRSLSLDYGSERWGWVNYPNRGVRGLKVISPIDETSWLRELTRDDRELRVKWIEKSKQENRPSRFPHVRAAITRVGEEPSPQEFFEYQRQAGENLYGVAPTVSTTVLPLGVRP